MRFWDFKRSSASVRLLVEFGQERGLDAARILSRSRLKVADLADPAIELEASQELCVVGNLIRACKQPGLGLEVGMRYNFASYGLWGLGLISSATAGDAMALALRFIPLTFAFCRITGSLKGRGHHGWHDHHGHPRGRSAVDHRLAVVIELGRVEVAMRVDPGGHAAPAQGVSGFRIRSARPPAGGPVRNAPRGRCHA